MATRGVSDLDQCKSPDFLCSICRGQDKYAEGEYFCFDCSHYYCSSCVKFHDEDPAFKNHKLLYTTQLIPSLSEHFLALFSYKCRYHCFKSADLFCSEHEIVGCFACMVVNHRTCKDIVDLRDYIKNNPTAVNLNKIIEQLNALARNLAKPQTE